ncbi:MAG: GNAT family N-acetyltransferase [Bacteroidetes bacterium]|nr:GNAT family N-acetyltransferase [Bacteroidota bacterium]
MIQLQKLSVEDKKQLKVIKKIYETSFPPNERRDFKKILLLLSDDRFNISAILFEDEVVGMLSDWDFKTFTYIEHFAISPDIRGNGLGSYVLNNFILINDKLVVLEVEIPEDENSYKRIMFYERFGFNVCKETYIQPPYDEGKEAVPMLIMINREPDTSLPFKQIEKTLHQEVYGFSNE